MSGPLEHNCGFNCDEHEDWKAARAAVPSVEPYTDDASPEPTPGLREAAELALAALDSAPLSTLGHGTEARRALRAALAASPAPEPPRCEHGAIREPCIPCSEPTPEPTRPDDLRTSEPPLDVERLAEAIHADDHPEQTPASEEACRRNDRAKAERLIALLAKK